MAETESEEQLCEDIDWRLACSQYCVFRGGAVRVAYLGYARGTDESRMQICGPYIFLDVGAGLYRVGPVSLSALPPTDSPLAQKQPPWHKVCGIGGPAVWSQYVPLANGELVYVLRPGESWRLGCVSAQVSLFLPDGSVRDLFTDDDRAALAVVRDSECDDVLYELNDVTVHRWRLPLADWLAGRATRLGSTGDPVDSELALPCALSGAGSGGDRPFYKRLCVCQSAQVLCFAGTTGSVIVLDKQSFTVRHCLRQSVTLRLPRGPRSIDCSNDLLVVSDGKTHWGFNLHSGHQLFQVNSATFSDNCLHVSAAAFTVTDMGSSAVLLSLQDGSLLRRFKGHRTWLQLCRHDPSGRALITGSSDKTVRVWDMETGEQLQMVDLGAELKCVVLRGRRIYAMTVNALWALEHDPQLDATVAKQQTQVMVEAALQRPGIPVSSDEETD